MMKAVRFAALLAATLLTLASCRDSNTNSSARTDASPSGWTGFSAGVKVPTGTVLEVRLANTISSETASSGENWRGTLVSPVTIGDKVAFHAGSPVIGVVSSVRPAKKGDRATIDLSVRQVVDEGKTHSVNASTEAIVAGSTRARNLGAIAGGAAAGALIGKAVGGDGKDAAVGGLLGGAAATGIVAGSKGYQVVLKPGAVVTFTLNNQVVVR